MEITQKVLLSSHLSAILSDYLEERIRPTVYHKKQTFLVDAKINQATQLTVIHHGIVTDVVLWWLHYFLASTFSFTIATIANTKPNLFVSSLLSKDHLRVLGTKIKLNSTEQKINFFQSF